MFATQLVRILDTLPSRAKNETRVFDSDELHGKMKENQNKISFHINSSGRYADPLATKIDDKDSYWNTPELECAMVMDEFAKVNVSEIERSPPRLHSEFIENETDFYTDKNVMECELPELMVCYKERGAYHVVKDICVDEGIHSEEKNLIGNLKCDDTFKGNLETESFTKDRLRSSSGKDFPLNASSECGSQENSDSDLLAQDTHNSIISSIPINDENELAEKGCHIKPLIQDRLEVEYEDEEKGKKHNDCDATDEYATKLLAKTELHDAKGIQISVDESNDIAFPENGPSLNTGWGDTEDCDLLDQVQTVKDNVPAIDKLMNDASQESDSSGKSSISTYRPQTSLKFLLNSSEFGTDDGDNDEQQPRQIPVVAGMSKISGSTSDAGELRSSGQASGEVESGSIGLDLDTEMVDAFFEEETSKDNHNLPIEVGDLDNHSKTIQEQYGVGESSFSVACPVEGLPTYVGLEADESSDTASLARVVQRSGWESSFSVGGPVSDGIAYSGQIPFSGSISLRSESSATSTRSFAFPVLQNEWNSSPVRMAKAERRRFHKHRGWRQGLLCCRF